MTALDQIRLHLATSDAAARAATPGELLPCPFCGGAAHNSGLYYECDNPHPQMKISCQDCWEVYQQRGLHYRDFQKDKVSGEAELTAATTAAWNTRTHSPAAILRMNAVVRELVEALERVRAGLCYLDEYRVVSEGALQRAAERLQPAPAGKEG